MSKGVSGEETTTRKKVTNLQRAMTIKRSSVYLGN